MPGAPGRPGRGPRRLKVPRRKLLVRSTLVGTEEPEAGADLDRGLLAGGSWWEAGRAQTSRGRIAGEDTAAVVGR